MLVSNNLLFYSKVYKCLFGIRCGLMDIAWCSCMFVTFSSNQRPVLLQVMYEGTGKSRGFGFVSFEEPEAAERVTTCILCFVTCGCCSPLACTVGGLGFSFKHVYI